MSCWVEVKINKFFINVEVWIMGNGSSTNLQLNKYSHHKLFKKWKNRNTILPRIYQEYLVYGYIKCLNFESEKDKQCKLIIPITIILIIIDIIIHHINVMVLDQINVILV